MTNKQIFVAGIQKQSLIDYPGKVACVIFLAGCNMRCHYCHNPQLFESYANQMPFGEVLAYLRNNRTLLDAVVISGGEPTINPHLIAILRQLRLLGLAIKLDTNGTNPDLLRKLVEQKLVDYVALDVKATPQKYPAITGASIEPVLVAVNFLKTQNIVPYMFRTTLTPRLTAKDMQEIGAKIINGARLWQIQQCRIDGAYSTEKVREIANSVKNYTQDIVVKGL